MIFKRADILLPNFSKDANSMNKWSVIACDQYTQDVEYWENTKNLIGNNPSTLNIIVPEVYLNNSDIDERIKNVNTVMEGYINEGTFKQYANSFIYVDFRPSKYDLIFPISDLLKHHISNPTFSSST